MADSILDMAQPSGNADSTEPFEFLTTLRIDDETSVHLHQLVFDDDDHHYAVVDLTDETVTVRAIDGHGRNGGIDFGRRRTVEAEQFHDVYEQQCVTVAPDNVVPVWAY